MRKKCQEQGTSNYSIEVGMVVLVERVEGFATADEWQRAYDEINAFEKMWTDEGAIILKFFIR